MSYLTQHFKGQYRIVPELSPDTHDIPRQEDGSVDSSYDDLYIKCSFGNKIYYYGHGAFVAYIPSIGRGKNILKKLDENNILYYNTHIYDSEVEFKFKAADMETVANLLKAKTSGANISPFSSKNFPKSDVSIPTDKIEKYKSVIATVEKGDLLVISKFTQAFLSDILAKKLGYRNKPFDYKTDMKKLMMSRQIKEYIYTKNMWDEYLKYLEEQIKKFYNDKEK